MDIVQTLMPIVKTVIFCGGMGVCELMIRAYLIYEKEGVASNARYCVYAGLLLAFMLYGMATDLLIPL